MSTREAPPAGWTKTTVGEVGRVQLGRQRSPKNHSGPHMRPYLRVANVFEDLDGNVGVVPFQVAHLRVLMQKGSSGLGYIHQLRFWVAPTWIGGKGV